MASILTIWQQHPEWGAAPKEHREAMDEAAKDYVLQLKNLDRPAAARIARADLQDMQAVIDFADIDLYDEETATPFERQARKMQEAFARIYDTQIRPLQEAMQKTLGTPAPATESPDRRKAKAMREFCGLIARYLDIMEIDWRHSTGAEPQQQGQALQPQSGELPLPVSLNTETAQKVFGRAIAKEWMSKTASGYKWQGIDGKGRPGQQGTISLPLRQSVWL